MTNDKVQSIDATKVTYNATTVDAALDAMSKGASAQSNAVQSIASGVIQKVLLASEVFDTSMFDPATSRFTPTVAGKYIAIGTVSFVASASMTVGSRIMAISSKNGTSEKSVSGAVHSLSPGINSIQHVAIYDMNGSTDYIELYARQDSGTSQNITDSASTSMTVYRLGS